MVLSYCAISEPGIVRQENQDNVYCGGQYRSLEEPVFRIEGRAKESAFLAAVSDGMGGEANGAGASMEVIGTMGEIQLSGGVKELTDYLAEKNAALCDMIRTDGCRTGATFAGLLMGGRYVHAVNIGDSRIYLMRQGKLQQLSHDHTAVQTMVDMGILSPKEARRHPNRHRLSQHLGIFQEDMLIEPYIVAKQVEKGDQFLLCSDGLTEMVEDEQIARILNMPCDVKERCEALVAEAKENGGKDNISVVLIGVEND